MIPGWSRNWFRTSITTLEAARPTARIARAEKRNATDPPIRSPTSTSGSSTRIPAKVNPSSSRASWKDPKSEVAAITAVAMAIPFVMAFVVFPTASRPVMISSASSPSPPDISAIPWALSATGP